MSILDYVMGMKSAGAGGGSSQMPLYVDFEYDGSTNTGILNKTYAEITNAFEGGRRVLLKVPYSYTSYFGDTFNYYSELSGYGAATQFHDAGGATIATYGLHFGEYDNYLSFGSATPTGYPTFPATAATVDYTYYYQIVDVENTINIDVSDGTLLTNNASITLPDFSYGMMIYGYNDTFGYSGYYFDMQTSITPTTSGVYNNAIGYTSLDAYAEGNYLYAGGITRIGSYDNVFPQSYSIIMGRINLEFSLTVTAAS